MRRPFGIVAAASVAGAALLLPSGAGAVSTLPSSVAFSGYATSTAIHTNVLQVAAVGPLIENTAVAFSGASVDSKGQATALTNEMGLGIQPAKADRESYGRGSGLEVGVAKTLPNNPDTNQVIQGGLAEAGALPLESTPATPNQNQFQTGVVTRETLKQTVNPVVFASVLRGQAQALWNDQSVLGMVGNPLGFGLGFADDVQLLNAGAAPVTGEPLLAPVVSTDTTAASGERTTSQTLSFTYLVNNGDGTCGLASESRMTLAPVRVNLPPDANPDNDTTIEVLGEFILRSVATGKAPGTVTFAPANGGPNEPIVRIIQPSGITNVLTFQQLITDPAGLVREVLPLISVAVAEKPRAIAAVPTADPDETKPPITTLTEASGAVDILRLRLLPGVTTAAGVNALDLRLGHFEAKAVVPEGGINCQIPVTKSVSPNPAMAGSDITFTVTIPSSADALIPFPCELARLKVVDVTSVKSGTPKFTVVGGTGPSGQAGVVDGNTITFADLGTYKPGDPPLKVTIIVRLAEDSGVGELEDTVTVTATPENCKAQANAVGRAIGGGSGAGSLFGLAGLTGTGLAGGGGTNLTGTATLSGPDTVPAPAVVPVPKELPKTGGSSALPALAGLGLGAGLLGRRLRTRRA
ncbi:MAG: hypothetical protein M3Q68_07735 [Actinomycetota bacterium]|nr:hypothetical protein [Actinomycetota bacterium]